MSTTTTNLGLTLPAGTDPADIADLNTNFTTIDTFAGQQTAKDTSQDARMTAIENDAADRDGRLTALETSDTSQNGRLTTLETSDTSQNGRLTALETSDTSQNSRLTTLETSDTTQNGRLTTLEQTDTTHAARLTAIEAKDTAQNTTIAKLVDAGAKNLLKNDAVSRSTVTVNSDGTMTINGTDSASVNLTISDSTVLPPGDYVLSSGEIASNVYLTVRIATGGDQYTCTGTRKTVPFHLDDETQIERIYLFINSGTEISDLTIKPMICTADDYAASPDYVPYVPTMLELYQMIKALQTGGGTT